MVQTSSAATVVVAVHRHDSHVFSKTSCTQISLLAGLGVDGDAHCGETVKHRSRVAKDPTQPNLRQVHLMPAELFAELGEQGFRVTAGALGENITTQGLNLIELPCDTVLHIGDEAAVRITGLRNPCSQIEAFQPGLLAAVLGRDTQGQLVRKAGVMSVVLRGGIVRLGDAIRIELPEQPFKRLERV